MEKERENPYFRICFPDMDPLDETFAELSLSIFGPILTCEEKI